MADPTLYLSEADVAALVDLNDAIEALQAGLLLDAAGGALDIPKALGLYGDGGSLHSLGSALPEEGWGGFKTWTHNKVGAGGIMSVFDLTTGRLAALLEPGALGMLRTAGITGLGTRWLAAPEADDLAMIGSGRQALMQIAAVAAVRPLRRLRLFSPTRERLLAFAEKVRARFDVPVETAASVEAALKDASIVTLATRATAPFVHAGMLTRGAHVNAVGAILPVNAEFDQDVFDRADVVAVDTLAGAQRNSVEFKARFGSDPAGWGLVRPLGAIIAEGRGRPPGADLTLFKPMGMGLSDLSVARLVIERATAAGVGLPIHQSGPAAPRWRVQPAPQEA